MKKIDKPLKLLIDNIGKNNKIIYLIEMKRDLNATFFLITLMKGEMNLFKGIPIWPTFRIANIF